MGDWEGALEFFDLELRIRQEVVARNPNDAKAKMDLATTWFALGMQGQTPRGDIEGAAHSFQEALWIEEALAKADPKDVYLQYDLALSHIGLGNTLLALRDFDRALWYERKAVEIQDAAARMFPDRAQDRTTLGYAYLCLAEAQATVAQARKQPALCRQAIQSVNKSLAAYGRPVSSETANRIAKVRTDCDNMLIHGK
jgi:tetratricopeptide (TPR) repeat protein